MVTGSHIPAERNGLKFYTPLGEITKEDEAGIGAALDTAEIPGMAVAAAAPPPAGAPQPPPHPPGHPPGARARGRSLQDPGAAYSSGLVIERLTFE